MHPSDDLARRVAARLASTLDPSLPALTEGALADRGATSRGGDAFLDPATASTIATVIVTAAQLGWQVYRDLKADRDKAKEEARRAATPTRELILRRMRLRLASPSGVSENERDRVYEAVVDEILLQDPGE